MILSRADALELHGHYIECPSYREGDDPFVDALLSRLEAFIAGGDTGLRTVRVGPLEITPLGHSVKVQPYQPHETP